MRHPDCKCERAVHLHGQRTTYNAHRCRCAPCTDAAREYRLHRNRAAAQEKWNPELSRFVDATPARQHVLNLHAQGMTYQAIAKLASLGQTFVTYLVNGKAGRDAPPARMRREQSDRILAIQFDPLKAAERIDATGSRRRVRALIAVGWTVREIAHALGIEYNTLRVHRDSFSQRIDAGRAKQIRELYTRWWNVTPTGPGAERARSTAKRKGWAPPMAWDDDTIDDPQAKPVGLRTRKARKAIDREELLWLVDQADDLNDLARALNTSAEYARQTLVRYHIPQPTRFIEATEALGEYRKGIRRTKFKQGRSA